MKRGTIQASIVNHGFSFLLGKISAKSPLYPNNPWESMDIDFEDGDLPTRQVVVIVVTHMQDEPMGD